MRRATLACLLLAACGSDPLTVILPTPELEGKTHLPMPQAAPHRWYQYQLEVKSRVRKDVQLEARLLESKGEGISVRLIGNTTIPREGTGWPTLKVVVPDKEGPFSGTLAIQSPDVPDWKVSYTFAGDVVPGGIHGRQLRARPPGMDLGPMRPGEERAFAIALASFGSETVTLTSWAADDPERVRVGQSGKPVPIRPGGEFQLAGTVVAPRAPGRFETRIRVQSDAENYDRSPLMIGFAGNVISDYAPHPPRAVEQSAYPVQEPEFKVVIRAREGVSPFTIAGASGHERYLQVLSLGSAEPKAEQTVKLKLRRDAPTDASRPAEWEVRLRIEPGGVEVAWPLRILLYPPIHAAPAELRFGRVAQGTGKEMEIGLSAFANRPFKVTGAHAESRLVRVTLPDHAPGTAWRVLVSLPRDLAPGNVEDRVVIETDDPDVPRLIVPVKAEIR